MQGVQDGGREEAGSRNARLGALEAELPRSDRQTVAWGKVARRNETELRHRGKAWMELAQDSGSILGLKTKVCVTRGMWAMSKPLDVPEPSP